MDALQASSGTVQNFNDIEDLIAASKKICLQWLKWLIDRSAGKRRKKNGKTDSTVKSLTNYLTKNKYDDDDEYDEDLENEYGEEVAL